MPWRRMAAVALLVYLVTDYSDPSVPGVFFFQGNVTFLDGVLDGRTSVLKARVPAPTPPAAVEARLEQTPRERRSSPLPPVIRAPLPRDHTRMMPSRSTDAGPDDH